MTIERRHRCGGSLSPLETQIVVEESAGFSLAFRVQGLVCDRCGQELIDRDTAVELQASQTPTVMWGPGNAMTEASSVTTERLDSIPDMARTFGSHALEVVAR